MTPQQKQLVLDLLITPPSGHRRISKEDFVTRFPEAVDGEALAVSLLAEAVHDESVEDLQCALIVGFAFNFSLRHENLLDDLAVAGWHISHEDVISALEKAKATSSKTVDALYKSTQISLPYLKYDDSRALAVKAIWTLGRIPGPSAEAKLKILASSDDPILSVSAKQRLSERVG